MSRSSTPESRPRPRAAWRAIREYVEGDEPFCLTYGDGVADSTSAKLVDFHRAHGKIATVTAVRPPSRFGEIRMEDGRRPRVQ